MKKILWATIFLLGFSFAAANKPVNPRSLPSHIKSYKNYLVILVHGMQAKAEAWDKYGFREELSKLTGDPDFKDQIFAYSFSDPYASYQQNGRQLGDRNSAECWLAKARSEYIAKHPGLSAAQIPQKFIFISHSMGALAVRSYIYSDTLAASGVDQNNFSYGFYQNDVKKAVFIAPTHIGSSMADFVMHYMASSDGYQVGPSGWLAELIKKLNLKGDSFAAAWGKARNYADQKFKEYLAEIQKTSLEYLKNNGDLVKTDLQSELNTKVSLPAAKIKYYVREYAKLNYQLDVVEQTTTNTQVVAQTEQQVKIRRDFLENAIKKELKQTLLQYGKSILNGSAKENKSDWLKTQLEAALVKSIEEFTDQVYAAAKNAEADVNAQLVEKTNFENWQELFEYLIYLDQQWVILSQKQGGDFKVEQWLNAQLKKQTGFNDLAELQAYLKTLKVGEELEKYVAAQMDKRQELDDIHVLYETLYLQNQDPAQIAKLDALTARYTRFQTFAALYHYLVDLRLEEKLATERDLLIAQNTDFKNWDQLCRFLKSISIEAEVKKALDQEIYLRTGFSSWEVFYAYLQQFSLEVYLKARADMLIEQYTGFKDLAALEKYIAELDLQKEWDKFFIPIQQQMEAEGYFFNIALDIKDWPFDQQPVLKVYWRNWTEFTPDLEQLQKDIYGMIDDYKFKIKLTDDIEFQTNLKEIKDKVERMTKLYNPLNRLFQIITEIDQAPLFSFPTVKVLLEVNNYCASEEVKNFLDYFVTQYALKKSLAGGAVPSLLSTNPSTQVLKNAELPDSYDPINYANVYSADLVAFDREETESFNKFFYGDLPALRGASSDIEKVLSTGIVPTVLANAYQIKLLTSPKYLQLPGGEARLAAVLLSYSRGVFTKSGDGAIDINSLRGKGVTALSGAKNYKVDFTTPELSDYVDHGFIEETLEAEAACLLIELGFNLFGGTTPPYVRGSVRLMPMFHFIEIVADNGDSIMADATAHEKILDPNRSISGVENSLYENPLVILKNIYTVSGNQKTELPLNALQAKTDDDQASTTVPLIRADGLIYIPYAYNVKEPKISLDAQVWDFAPQLAKIEYSYNFGAFRMVNADNWGNIILPDFSVAEGQNILVLKVTNKVGLTNTQYLRLIRSSTPLIASELNPQPFAQINKSNVPVSLKFYNAQFITNNITASQLDELSIDGKLVLPAERQIVRDQDNAYRNYLQLIAYKNLAEGEHQVEVLAHDVYGHSSVTRWTFTVDITPPNLIVSPLTYYAPSSNEKPKLELEIKDNISKYLKGLNISIKNASGNVVYHHPVLSEVACGPQVITLTGNDDYQHPLCAGVYQIILQATDRAGNKSEQMVNWTVDDQPPQIIEKSFSTQTMSRQNEKLLYQIKTNEAAVVSLQLLNREKNQKSSYVLNEFVTANNSFIFKHQFLFDDNGCFELADGHYQIVATLIDAAGNFAKTATENLLVDCTPPVIFGAHAEPLVLTNSQHEPYLTKVEYQIKPDDSPTSGTQAVAQVNVSAKIFNKNTGLIVEQFKVQTNQIGTNSFSWSAANANLPKGSYTVVLSAADIYNNIATAYCEVIKDGISPELTWPKRNVAVGGTVSILGKVADSDWTNVKAFDNYCLYWAAGVQTVPTCLNSPDQKIWQVSSLEVPFINRKPGQSSANVSYRPAEQNTLLGYWDTSALATGEYTILVVAAEKDIGATAACVRTVQIDNSGVGSTSVPYTFLKNKISTVDFSATKNVLFNILNANKESNFGVELIAPDNEVVKYFYATEVPGLSYYGEPLLNEQTRSGVYLWEDESCWHLRIRAATANPTAYKLTLAGVSSVRAATLDKSNYELRSGLLNISGTLNAELQKGLDFELQDNLASLYIDAVLDNKTAEQIPSTGSDIYLGAGKFNPGYAPYVLKLNLNGNNGLVSFMWDGRSQYGGYVDSGVYRCRISASGVDGYGFCVTETTLNVKTPFILQDAGITPADAQFNTFSSSPNSVAVKYLTNKDGYLTAKIYDEKNNLVCTLAEKTKTLGSSTEKILFWNGACPLPESTQRKVSGNYYLNLYYQPEDNTAAKNICYNNIKIVNNIDDTIFANLAPLGEALNYNGETVQNTAGASNYYWSARAQGKYSVPKSFTYKLEASGQQLVSVNTFVPFAALYHRGFNKVKDIRVTFYIRYYEGAAGNGNADSKDTSWSDLEITEAGPALAANCLKENSGMGRFDQGLIRVYLSDILMAEYSLTSFTGLKETYNRGILRIKNFSVDRYGDGHRHNANLLKYYDFSFQVDLLDNIKYSRLTNRYYAWYGYVNKDTGRTLDFSPWWQDLGKLGFVPASYFSNPQFTEKLRPITSGALAVTIDGKSILYDPQAVDSAAAVLAALEKENVLYESLHCTDNSYYNYLADEYTELIPMAMPVSINYVSHYLTKNMIDKCTVQTDFSRRELIAWPIDEETIISSINNTLLAVAKNINPREIVEVDYDKLPGLTDIKSVDFGGLGSSLQEATGIVSKHKAYKQKIADVFNFSNKYNLKLKITAVSDPDIEVCFDNGLRETTIADPAGLNVFAHYKTNAGLDSIKPWSTEMDPFLKHGVIDSQALVFNEDTFAPKTEYLSISDTYFDELNRPENIISQNVYPIDYYTFQEYNYYDKNSGRVTNPNLDIEKWDVAVYDQSGGINQDLEVTDLALDNENIFNNRFKIKLKLDAIEKRLVEVKGEASGPYELLYFDGTAWQNISTSNVPAAGRLTWWDVGRKNGKYTVALKVYRDKFGMPPYNIYTTEVYIGELLRAGDNALENKRVSSPYKRAEIYFHPNSYAEDKFITVTPITLEKLNIKNKPDIYTLGPIAEILPHGSSFSDPEKRPTLVYKYSADDLAELKKRGIDVRNLSVYYLNESGELEKANSEIASTNCGLEIRTVLSHFSPYALLEGDVPPLPKVFAGFSMARDKQIKLYGSATPNTLLEIYVDDDNVFGDQDGLKTISQMTVTSNAAAWIFDRRQWAADYADKLTAAEKEKILSERIVQQTELQKAIAQSEQNRAQIEQKYLQTVKLEQNNISQIKNYLAGQELVSSANGTFQTIKNSSGVQRIDSVDLSWQTVVPQLASCLPQTLLVETSKQELLQSGFRARKYYVQTDQKGYFEMTLPLVNTTANTVIYVTYPLSTLVKNRPVANIVIGQDPAAPQITMLEALRTTVNSKTKELPLTFNVQLSEPGKVSLRVFNAASEIVKTIDRSVLGNVKTLMELEIADLPDGLYHCQIMAIDEAGNTNFPTDLSLRIDTKAPAISAVKVPLFYNPERTSLNIKIIDPTEVGEYSLRIFYQGIQAGEITNKKYKFEPVYINNKVAELEYAYQLTIYDPAGNMSGTNNVITIDTSLPDCPKDFMVVEDFSTMVHLNWQKALAADLKNYVLSIIGVEQIVTKDLKTTNYYTEGIASNNFYRFQLASCDRAGNLSKENQKLITYIGPNKKALLVSANAAAVVSYNNCTVTIPINAVPENNLFVVQEEAVLLPSNVPGRKVISPIYRLLASERTTFDRNLKIEMKFVTSNINELQLRSNTIRIGFWNGSEWEDLDKQVTLNLRTGTVVAETPHFTEFAVIADQEYRAFDTLSAIIKFDTLRNNDFVDMATSISLTVQEDITQVNTNNMWLTLDDERFVIPAQNFIADPGSSGKSGKLYLNLQTIVTRSVTEGTHALKVFVTDLANNTANAEVLFTNKSRFEIKEVMNVPNPFDENGTAFTYQLSKPAQDIKIKIYTTNGRLVKELADCSNVAGFNSTYWDGRDGNNMFVANDVYIYTVIVGTPDGEREIIKGKAVAIR